MKFKEGELHHGQRYIVCIHTEYTEIQHEKWTQVLPEINTCSDGIVVDLTPPTAGNVWIGTRGQRYQVYKIFVLHITCTFTLGKQRFLFIFIYDVFCKIAGTFYKTMDISICFVFFNIL